MEKDKALERRFQPVYLDEPSVEDTIAILRGLKEKYEIHHGVRITDSAIIAAATLSHRYITDRFLPDKAIDLIDEAASRLKMEIDSVPTEIDEVQRRIMQMQIEIEALKKERDEASLERKKNLKTRLRRLRRMWPRRSAIGRKRSRFLMAIKSIKERIEKTKLEADEMERRGDLGKVAELRYGTVVALEREVETEK